MEDLPEILDSWREDPVSVSYTIDPALKEITFALLETVYFKQAAEKNSLPRCAQSPLSDVQNKTPPFVDFNRAPRI